MQQLKDLLQEAKKAFGFDRNKMLNLWGQVKSIEAAMDFIWGIIPAPQDWQSLNDWEQCVYVSRLYNRELSEAVA